MPCGARSRANGRGQSDHLFGVGDSAFLARSGDHRAMINGPRSKAVEAANAFKGIVKHLGDDDVVICISRSGRKGSSLAGRAVPPARARRQSW